MHIVHMSTATVDKNVNGPFLDVLEDYILSINTNNEISEATKRTYRVKKGQVIRYILANQFQNDHPEAWDESRLKHMVTFMRDDLKYSPQTIRKTQYVVMHTLEECKTRGLITKLPTRAKVKQRVPVIQFTTPEETELLRTWKFSARLTKVRDLYLAMVYSGVSFCDLPRLKRKNVTYIDGIPVIQDLRQKTNRRPFTIPLIPQLFELLNRYNWRLPKISNQKCNQYLKEIAAIVEMQKQLRTKDARCTCAMLYLRLTGNMDVAAAVLGHTSTDITRKFYAPYLPMHLIDALKKTTIFTPVLSALSQPAGFTNPVKTAIPLPQPWERPRKIDTAKRPGKILDITSPRLLDQTKTGTH